MAVMIEYLSARLSAFSAGPLVQRIIENQYVCVICRGSRFNILNCIQRTFASSLFQLPVGI